MQGHQLPPSTTSSRMHPGRFFVMPYIAALYLELVRCKVIVMITLMCNPGAMRPKKYSVLPRETNLKLCSGKISTITLESGALLQCRCNVHVYICSTKVQMFSCYHHQARRVMIVIMIMMMIIIMIKMMMLMIIMIITMLLPRRPGCPDNHCNPPS